MLSNPHIGSPLPSSKEMAALDQLVMKEQGLKSIELMERVGNELARNIRNLLSHENPSSRRVLILVGPGNNGGDGLVIARKFLQSGIFPVTVIRLHSSEYSSDHKNQLEKFLSVGGELIDWQGQLHQQSVIEYRIARSGCVIDSIFGTGQRLPLSDDAKQLIEYVKYHQRSEAIKLSIDIPTGVCGDTGQVCEGAYTPDYTLTVQYSKRGMTQEPARTHCGKVEALEVGITSENWASRYRSAPFELFDLLTKRQGNVHKGNFGHLLMIAGSTEMPGAAHLAVESALSTGAGKVTQLVFQSEESLMPEVMTIPATGEVFSVDDFHVLKGIIDNFQSVVIGPGLGRDRETRQATKKLLILLAKKKISAVVDADALNLLSNSPEYLSKNDFSSMIFTPHPTEMSRLLGTSTKEVQSNRFESAEKLASMTSGTVLLKGPGTIVTQGQFGYVNEVDNGTLAIPGSGDVLSGIIGALISQGIEPFFAAGLAAHLHGYAGAVSKDLKLASELSSNIRGILGELLV